MCQEIGNSCESAATHVTPPVLSKSVGEDEGRVNAAVETSRTNDTGAARAAEHHRAAAPRFATLSAIAATSRGWLIGFAVVAAIALASTAHDRVTLASGVAVAVLGVAAIVDVAERRLPDSIVLAAAVMFTICLAIDSIIGHGRVRLADAALGVAVFAGPLFVAHLVAPASMGFGDVKTAAVLGAATGIVDWHLALAGLALAAGFTAAVGLARRASTIAFGPGLVAAGAIVLAAHPIILDGHHATGQRQPTTERGCGKGVPRAPRGHATVSKSTGRQSASGAKESERVHGFRPTARRRNRLAAGLALGAVAVGGNVFVYSSLDSSEPVVQVVRDVPAGTQLTADMLRTVDADVDATVNVIAGAELDTLIGQYARVRLVSGSLVVAPALQSTPLVSPGNAVVAIEARASELPIGLRGASRCNW